MQGSTHLTMAIACLAVALLHAMSCGSRTRPSALLRQFAAAVLFQLVAAATASSFRSCDIGAISCPQVEVEEQVGLSRQKPFSYSM